MKAKSKNDFLVWFDGHCTPAQKHRWILFLLLPVQLPLFSTLPCLVSIVQSVVLGYFIAQWGACNSSWVQSLKKDVCCSLRCLGTLSSIFCREGRLSDHFQDGRLDESRWGVARESRSH
ncbi:hypothetical protein AVEN_12164-1 [Araneus ventricosus]|uniref:Uncharacterized protein n=1 Tax=Araneus ventricosus TaxID=182803 RepID=A0A4Y2L6T2_ARAVE|nr:hypothetical protein AVEN_12164-1 [Araneus ventricosus]